MKEEKVSIWGFYVLLLIALACLGVGIVTWDWRWFVRAILFAISILVFNEIKKKAET